MDFDFEDDLFQSKQKSNQLINNGYKAKIVESAVRAL